MLLRSYNPADLEQLITLFTQTIHIVSSQYYSPAEIEAWAPSHPNAVEWGRRLSENYTLVVESDGRIIGFGSLSIEAHLIDLLFTHHAHQGEGIGTIIMDALEKEALLRGCSELYLTTSATAWSFYQKRGYHYHKSERKVYGEVVFDCQVLRKVLSVFPDIRRKDRTLDNAQAIELLEKGVYGYLSMCAINGYGYGIPLNYVFSGNTIYFHCAPKGFKLDNIRQNNCVSFCVVGHTKVIPEQFTTRYESALVFGRIAGDLSEEEQLMALDLLVQKYSPAHVAASKTNIKKSFHRTNVLRLDIEHLSGKSKKIMKDSD